eukprot:Clim_evm84s225 gene=Clim_evmTU84s225
MQSLQSLDSTPDVLSVEQRRDRVGRLIFKLDDADTVKERVRVLEEIRKHLYEFDPAVYEKVDEACFWDMVVWLLKQRDEDKGHGLAAECVALLARDQRMRQTIADSGIPENILAAMQSDESHSVETTYQFIRAIGNCAFDEEKVRDQLLKIGAIELLGQKFNSKPHDDLMWVLAGAILNTSANHDANAEKYAKMAVHETLFKTCMTAGDVEVQRICMRALNALSVNETVEKYIREDRHLHALITWAMKANDETDIVIAFEMLVDCVEEVNLEPREEGLDTAVRFLSFAQSRIASGHSESSVLSLRLLCLSLMNDLLMQALMDSRGKICMDGLLTLMKTSVPDVAIWSCIATGNMARSDKNCSKIVNDYPEMVDNLMDLLESEDPRVVHASLSSLKNLSLPRANKQKMTAKGLPDRLSTVALKNAEEPALLFPAFGVLRSLTIGDPDLCEKIARDPRMMKVIFDAAEGVKIESLAAEAYRLIANIVRYGATKDTVELIGLKAIAPLIRLTNSEHAVMVNEGLTSLAVIGVYKKSRKKRTGEGEDPPVNLRRRIVQEGGGDAAVKVVKQGLLAPEIICNGLTLCEILKEYHVNLKEDAEFQDKLEQYRSNESTILVKKSEEVIAILGAELEDSNTDASGADSDAEQEAYSVLNSLHNFGKDLFKGLGVNIWDSEPELSDDEEGAVRVS